MRFIITIEDGSETAKFLSGGQSRNVRAMSTNMAIMLTEGRSMGDLSVTPAWDEEDISPPTFQASAMAAVGRTVEHARTRTDIRGADSAQFKPPTGDPDDPAPWVTELDILDYSKEGMGGPPNVLTSRHKSLYNYHYLFLDIDCPVHVVPSRTLGHWHIIFPVTMSETDMLECLQVLMKCGVIQSGYYYAAKKRGHATLRAFPTDTGFENDQIPEGWPGPSAVKEEALEPEPFPDTNEETADA